MKFLLDTNACVRYLNGRSLKLRQRVDATGDHEIAVSSVVEAELFFGAAKSNDPAKTLALQQRFITRFHTLAFDTHAAHVYGPLRKELEKAGISIGANDLLIAATALAENLTVVTHNVSEFQRVPGLSWEDWEV
jgi:tRNA(fMet)-specific endonuclease VapC